MASRHGVNALILGIIKGLREHADPGRYFGSTLGLRDHIGAAIDGCYVQRHKNGDIDLTAKGHREYERQGLADAPEGRAYTWIGTRWWDEPAPVGDGGRDDA